VDIADLRESPSYVKGGCIYIPDIDDARAYSDRCEGIFQDGRAF
jgi:hypothetical protein